MNGKEFIRKVRKFARTNQVVVRVEPGKGKGSHQRLYYGDQFTTVKSSEIKEGLLNAMCKQLGINKDDL